jgi:hypothetical protein
MERLRSGQGLQPVVMTAAVTVCIGAGLFGWVCILIALGISSALLGALSPALYVFVSQAPACEFRPGVVTKAYWSLLLLMTSVIGVAGVTGNVVLFRLLFTLTGSSRMSLRVLITWMLIMGFTGSQISWFLSPFICRPDFAVSFWNPQALATNFYEQLWMGLNGMLAR